jgi:hypothetical protein
MPETITTLTGFEAKPGSNAQGAYVLNIFTDAEGKKFKTFDDDIADEAKKLIGPLVVLEFDVRSQNRNGRTFTDNFIQSIKDASEVSTADGQAGGDVAAVSPVAAKILAFRASVDLLVAMPEAFGDTPNFVALTKVADAIYDWASRSTDAVEAEVEPEPEPEPVTN